MRFALALLVIAAFNLSAMAQVNTLSGPVGNGYPILLEPPLSGGLNNINTTPLTPCTNGQLTYNVPCNSVFKSIGF